MAAHPGTTVQRLRDVLHGHPDVQTAYLFGSVARGTSGAGDVDLAVVFGSEVPLQTALELQVELESETDVAVDLHDLERLPVDLQFRVIREGEILVDREPARRVRLEIRTLNAFNDFRPYLERLRAASRGRLAAELDHG